MKDNKIIAEFMGYSENTHPLSNTPITPKGIDSMCYSNWNWLMPVVHLIKDSQVYGTQHLIDDIDNFLTCDSSIENVYFGVLAFIREFNSYNDKLQAEHDLNMCILQAEQQCQPSE